MITARIFRQSNPAREIDSRPLVEGEITIGRDETADWILPDPSRTLSRRHCALALHDGVVTLRDDSVNGVFNGLGERLSFGTPIPIDPGEVVVLGPYLVRVDAWIDDPGPDDGAATAPQASPADHSQAGRLLDAFCGGAQIDSSLVSGEDPAEVMRRLGTIYRQMVLGLGALMDERTRTKVRHGLERTTVQAADNNPFRWAPPERVAIDLLRAEQDGFLGSAAAVRSSFEDVTDHHRALAAGVRAAMETVLAELAPETICQTVKTSAFLPAKRAETAWSAYAQVHADMTRNAKALGGPSAARAFREAYADAVEK